MIFLDPVDSRNSIRSICSIRSVSFIYIKSEKRKYKIVGLPLLKTNGVYYIPCKQGDSLELETRLIELKNSSLTLQHIINKEKQIASIGYETRVWAKKKLDKVYAEPFPSDIREKLLTFVKDEILK